MRRIVFAAVVAVSVPAPVGAQADPDDAADQSQILDRSAPAAAQASSSRRRLTIGIAATLFEPAQDDRNRSVRLRPLVRLGGRRRGLGPAIGFDWFRTKLDAQIPGARVLLGEVKVYPLVAGVAYRVPVRRVSMAWSLMGGYAFNTRDFDEQARVAYRDRMGMTVTDFKISNSVAVNGSISIWYDTPFRFSLMGGAGYLFTRPTITLVTADGARSTTRNLDTVILKVGIAYQVF